jgi:hypothetical protein
MGGGAPAKAGADLSALGFVSVDLSDSAWTLTDPDGLVDTVSHSGGVNTVTMNALGTGNLHYSWVNATNMRAPRWHKELKIADADGAEQQVVSGDTFTLQVLMEYQAASSRFATQMVAGIAEDATATVYNSIDLLAGLIQYPKTGNQAGGAFGLQSGAIAPASSLFHRVWAVANFSGGRMGTPTYITSQSSGAILASGQRATNQAYTDLTTNLDIMIGLGTLGAQTINAGEDAKIKVWYRVVRFTLP